MNRAGVANLVASVLEPPRQTRDSGVGIDASVFNPTPLTRSRDVDLTDYFSAEVARKMPAIERTMYANKVRNHWMLEDLGESYLGCACRNAACLCFTNKLQTCDYGCDR